jgi:CheY-like chemotaxis protein
MVIFEVEDTGTGIPPEILPRIFDAFFTTKPLGIGTGLGLAICHRLLTAMDGRVEVDSQVGVGTTFRVFLPRARTGQTRESIVAPSPPPALPLKSSASVLVVEDESALGRVLARLLTPHRVTAVSRARDALTLIRRGERFDVVLCDLMMPEMTGMEFYAELSTMDPAVAQRVVFMTGGAFTSSARTFLESVPNVRLDKPLDTARLRRLVDDMAGAALPAA